VSDCTNVGMGVLMELGGSVWKGMTVEDWVAV